MRRWRASYLMTVRSGETRQVSPLCFLSSWSELILGKGFPKRAQVKNLRQFWSTQCQSKTMCNVFLHFPANLAEIWWTIAVCPSVSKISVQKQGAESITMSQRWKHLSLPQFIWDREAQTRRYNLNFTVLSIHIVLNLSLLFLLDLYVLFCL